MFALKRWNLARQSDKKFHNHQKHVVDQAVADIVRNPVIGEAKKDDLSGVYVHRFDCIHQLFLLAYEHGPTTLVLLLGGTHEHFYHNLKR
ncbi:MAG: type II toxin-antitoxin system RelE/ParE family toxin [Betaproteobacteria bacterium]|nr:type II toxin-antitoxin system RelE/ParE family toxin [Betaproteobacteria bacterium]